jgi:hypothetical protein
VLFFTDRYVDQPDKRRWRRSCSDGIRYICWCD